MLTAFCGEAFNSILIIFQETTYSDKLLCSQGSRKKAARSLNIGKP